MLDAYILFVVLSLMLGLFVWGYWRYDVVASLALMLLVVLKIVPFSQAFIGFSNPAVITVACVMVITATITRSGIMEYVVRHLTHATSNTILHLFTLTFITAILSAFMNNVGALALMMPVAIQTAPAKLICTGKICKAASMIARAKIPKGISALRRKPTSTPRSNNGNKPKLCTVSCSVSV